MSQRLQHASVAFAKGQQDSLNAINLTDVVLTTHEEIYRKEMISWWRKVQKRPWLFDMAYLMVVTHNQWAFLLPKHEEQIKN
tara:strand:- start:191 stop:436 length:246 start_codon:yes stop_codon:yes gene_type:complete